jgi:hypothetical protein
MLIKEIRELEGKEEGDDDEPMGRNPSISLEHQKRPVNKKDKKGGCC